MTLTLNGDDVLISRLNGLTKTLKTTFWGLVRTDLEQTLLDNVEKHHVTGKLERNVYAETIDGGVEAGIRDNGMIVSWNGKRVNYGTFVNYGTAPHTIEPKGKSTLRFISSGGFVFAKKVKHPGYKGSFFIQNTAKEVFARLDKHFNEALIKDIK